MPHQNARLELIDSCSDLRHPVGFQSMTEKVYGAGFTPSTPSLPWRAERAGSSL